MTCGLASRQVSAKYTCPQWRIQDFSFGGEVAEALWGGGAPTSNLGAFQQKRMRKRKDPPGSANDPDSLFILVNSHTYVN